MGNGLKQKKCVACGVPTDMACSDCRIDLKATVPICGKTACLDEHQERERRGSGTILAERDAAIARAEAAEKKRDEAVANSDRVRHKYLEQYGEAVAEADKLRAECAALREEAQRAMPGHEPSHAPAGESPAPGGPSPSGRGRLSEKEIAELAAIESQIERDGIWTRDSHMKWSRSWRLLPKLLAEVRELREYVAEDSECTCGCPVADHERYDEGLSCEHEDHECLSCCPSIATMLQELRAENTRLRVTVERQRELLRDAISYIECETYNGDFIARVRVEMERKDGAG